MATTFAIPFKDEQGIRAIAKVRGVDSPEMPSQNTDQRDTGRERGPRDQRDQRGPRNQQRGPRDFNASKSHRIPRNNDSEQRPNSTPVTQASPPGESSASVVE